MSFVYDPATESCHDPDSGVTVTWHGGGGADGLNRGLRLSHCEWDYITSFMIEERDIHYTVAFGDLTRNEVSVTTSYGLDPVAIVGPHGLMETQLSGTLPSPAAMRRILHQALSCLYSSGGRDPVRVEGLLTAEDERAA